MHRRITINPAICSGKPVIANTRVLVANILADLADGLDYDQIILNYPNIKKEDIVACLEFGSELARFETVGIDRAV